MSNLRDHKYKLAAQCKLTLPLPIAFTYVTFQGQIKTKGTTEVNSSFFQMDKLAERMTSIQHTAVPIYQLFLL